MNKLNFHKVSIYGLAAVVAIAVCLPGYARNRKKTTDSSSVAQRLSANDQKRYDYFFLEAARQQAAGKYDAAFDLFEHARSINPSAAEVYYSEAMYFSQLKNDSLALDYLEKATRLNPDNTTYLERVAQYYIGTQNYSKAIDAYERLVEKSPDNTDALNILVQLYQQDKNYPEMISTINRIETVEGSSEQITLSKMHVYEMMKDKKSAYRELKSLSEKHPGDLNYRIMLGNWLMQNDKQKDAYKLFSDALKEEPDNAYALSSLYDYYNASNQDSLAKSLMVRILMNKKAEAETKLTLLRQAIQKNESEGGDSTQILSLFDKVLAQPQINGDIATMKALYMSMKKMPEDSLKAAYAKVLEIAPDNAQARLQIIQLLWDEKKYDEVITMCKPAQQYNPDEMVFYYFQGLAYYQKKDDDHALETFRRGVSQINSQSNPNIVSDFYSIMGDILHTKGMSNEAFAAYDSCLQWKDDNIGCLNNYAYYLSVENKDLPKAEQMSYKTIKAEPKNATYLDTYAWILFMEERYPEAKIYIDQAKTNLDSLSSSGTIFEHLGDIYYMNGLQKDAVEFWKQAVDKDTTLDIAKWKLTHKQYITEQEYNKKWKKDSSK